MRLNHSFNFGARFAGLALLLGGVAGALAASNEQVNDLLAKMTLDEKIGQMVQVDSAALKDQADVKKYCIGSVLSGGNSNPADNRPATWLAMVNGFQAQALQTRLKIPLLYGIDAVHGNNNIQGAVIFPHEVGLGAANNPALIEKAARVTADEVEGVGIRWAFAPCIAVSRDIRWGRSYESFGQSPELVGLLGAAAIRGLQGDHLNPNSVLACAKHFAGDGGTENGKDEGNTVCDEATFRKLYLAPYTDAIKAGVGSIMVSFSSWNGLKMHGNKYLLTDVLKNEMGFQGFLVSDWAAIDQLGPDYKKDIETSINAGLDMVMITAGPGEPHNYAEFIADLKDLVASGKVSAARIDDAVRRILRVKLQMGLFEKPYPDAALTAQIGSPEHRQAARQCVRESLVLLKNSDHVLPLRKDLKRIVVTGQAADDLSTQCGGWTIDWQGAGTNQIAGGTTLLAAIKQAVGPDTEVLFSAAGHNLKELKPADVVIAVIGEKPYAEFLGDRQDLRLAPADAELIARAKAIGAPVVTVLYSGRPLVLGAALEQSDAFVAAWLPGTEGQGMTDVLFGDFQPSGKLPRLWPASNDQVSVDHVVGQPQFAAGFGLTYTLYSQNK
jgi:beta-glucosidase